MRLLVNTLSVGHLSGQHVVYGLLRPLAKQLEQGDCLFVLHYEGQQPPQEIITEQVKTIAVPDKWRNWAARFAWETTQLPRLVRQHGIDVVLSTSGAITPILAVPQATIAMSPWCYVREAQKGRIDHFKAWLQRNGYRRAYRQAALIFYISAHIRDLYREANRKYRKQEGDSAVTWVGLDDKLFAAARAMKEEPRRSHSILSVSVLARWKGVETLVRAVHLLRQRGLPVTLDLVGPWSHQDYEVEIRQLIDELGLVDNINIHGHVSVEELYRFNATSTVFCLMSTCESFGIPSAEAMAFGTPVVSTDCTAIQEVCAGAGLFVPRHDVKATAGALYALMTDEELWRDCSSEGVARASKLTWEQCAEPFASLRELADKPGAQSKPARV